MTLARLFARLLTKSDVRDPAKVPFDDALEIIEEINAAVAEFYILAPARFSRSTLPLTLAAPATLSLPAVNGSPAFGGAVFTEAQRGATIIIGDDPRQNEIVSTTDVASPYQGITGTVSATVYGDAIPVGISDYKRVISDPLLDSGRRLTLDPALESRQIRKVRGVGSPSRYWIENGGAAGGSSSLGVFRVDPIPSVATNVRLEVFGCPVHFTYESLVSSQVVPVPPDMEKHLITLCRWHLKDHPFFWEIPSIETDAAASRLAIGGQSPSAGPTRSKVGTPRGW